MHLTPKIVFRLIKSTCYSKHFGAKSFEFAWILDFLCPLKVTLEVLHDRVLGRLGRRLLMMSTQQPNTMAPQPALCLWPRKWKAKLVVSIYFGTKTSEVWLRIISCSSLESELSFDSKDWSEKTSSAFDNCEITAWGFESTLQYFKRRWGRPVCGRAACILGMES